jgi:hypothetical protein
MLLVSQLAQQAVAATLDDPEGSAWNITDIYRLLDVDGRRNFHLANPLNHPRVGHIRARRSPLLGTEPVFGDYLSLAYCAHDPFVRLDDHDDLASLETSLLSPSGIVNPYITYCIAFVTGKVAPFKVMFRGPDGSIRRLDKYQQHKEFKWNQSDNEQYPDRRVVWQ